MEPSNALLIGPKPGYSPAVGHLVSMLDYTRRTTLSCVHGLSTEELDELYDDESNSIGALLLHIAAVEHLFRVFTIEDRELEPEERSTWESALDLGNRGRTEIRGFSLEHYLSTLKRIRADVLEDFAKCDDDWLFSERPMWGTTANNYFIWYHKMEDEIHHRGQISWLRKRICGSRHA